MLKLTAVPIVSASFLFIREKVRYFPLLSLLACVIGQPYFENNSDAKFQKVGIVRAGSTLILLQTKTVCRSSPGQYVDIIKPHGKKNQSVGWSSEKFELLFVDEKPDWIRADNSNWSCVFDAHS